MSQNDITSRHEPLPSRMPKNAQEWAHRLDLSNFVNAYYQYRDIQKIPACRTVLMVGPGQGLGTQVLKWRGYSVTTFDIDPALNPDQIGSVHDLSCFGNAQFDVLIASHVLEHIPETLLDRALAEIARSSRYSLIYLPVNGLHAQVRLNSNYRGLDRSLLLTFSKWFERPDRITPRYMSGQHYWEIGLSGFHVRSLVKRMENYFDILVRYRNKDWLPSYNFVLKSKRK